MADGGVKKGRISRWSFVLAARGPMAFGGYAARRPADEEKDAAEYRRHEDRQRQDQA